MANNILRDFIMYFNGTQLPASFWSNLPQSSNGSDIRVYSNKELTVELDRYIVSLDINNKTLEMYVKMNIDQSQDNRFWVTGGGPGRPNDSVWLNTGYSYTSPFNNSTLDISGSLNSPVLIGVEGYVNGMIGRAFRFSGSNAMNFSGKDLFGESGYSCGMWLNLDSDQLVTSDQIILSNTDGIASWLKLVVTADSTIKIMVRDLGMVDYEVETAISKGVWHQIAISYNNLDRFTLYIDGVQVTYLEINPVSPYSVNTYTYVGCDHGSTSILQASSLDELRFMTYQSDEASIYSEYQNKTAPNSFYTRVPTVNS